MSRRLGLSNPKTFPRRKGTAAALEVIIDGLRGQLPTSLHRRFGKPKVHRSFSVKTYSTMPETVTVTVGQTYRQ